MADVAEVQYKDVSEYTHGTDTYLGIQDINVNRIRGVLSPVRKEGELVASSFELVGTDEGPITFTMTSRAASTLSTLADLAAGTVTFTTRNAGASANRTVTMTGVQYERSTLRAVRDSDGAFSISGKALTCTEAAAS